MKIPYLFALIFFPFSAFAADENQACPQYVNVTINVRPLFEEPDYDYSRTISTIQNLASDTHHSIHENLALGLTRYEPYLHISLPIVGVTLPNGFLCAHVDHLDVEVGYRNVSVLIANEISKGSCGFNEIMAHEQKHIAVNRQVLAEFIPVMTETLRNYMHDNGSVQGENAEYAMSVLHKKLQDIINELVLKMTLENQARQRNVDSPEEYKRITYSCNGELANLTRRYIDAFH